MAAFDLEAEADRMWEIGRRERLETRRVEEAKRAIEILERLKTLGDQPE